MQTVTFHYEHIDLEVKRPAFLGTCHWFPVHVRVFMASEPGANAATLSRLRTTRENRVTPLPPKRIAYYRQTRARNSHARIPRTMSPKLERFADAGNSKRMNEAETRMKRKRKYRSFSIQATFCEIFLA